MKKSTRNHLALLWADYDPHAQRGQKWATYATRADQRSQRPDLKPIRVALVPVQNNPAQTPEGRSPGGCL